MIGYAKVCSKCKQFKPVENFYKNCQTSDGLQAFCKVCDKKRLRVNHELDAIKQEYKDLTRINETAHRRELQREMRQYSYKDLHKV